ncbi:IS3 family transposase [Bacillus sp. FJAT-28004]|uniref:IS3 family transposase n=1 Tax=Bacillus sp. FJAT-28004 TaxID=1679165 RepID=UPI0006B678D3
MAIHEIESFFSNLEQIYLTILQSISDLEQAIQEYDSFYNNERFQKNLNDRSRIEARNGRRIKMSSYKCLLAQSYDHNGRLFNLCVQKVD